MAAKVDPYKKKEIYPYPSRFGSHIVMEEQEETVKLAKDGYVVCKDEGGLYVTQRNRLDSGLADNHRYDEETRKMYQKLLEKQEKE